MFEMPHNLLIHNFFCFKTQGLLAHYVQVLLVYSFLVPQLMVYMYVISTKFKCPLSS